MQRAKRDRQHESLSTGDAHTLTTLFPHSVKFLCVQEKPNKRQEIKETMRLKLKMEKNKVETWTRGTLALIKLFGEKSERHKETDTQIPRHRLTTEKLRQRLSAGSQAPERQRERKVVNLMGAYNIRMGPLRFRNASDVNWCCSKGQNPTKTCCIRYAYISQPV